MGSSRQMDQAWSHFQVYQHFLIVSFSISVVSVRNRISGSSNVILDAQSNVMLCLKLTKQLWCLQLCAWNRNHVAADWAQMLRGTRCTSTTQIRLTGAKKLLHSCYHCVGNPDMTCESTAEHKQTSRCRFLLTDRWWSEAGRWWRSRWTWARSPLRWFLVDGAWPRSNWRRRSPAGYLWGWRQPRISEIQTVAQGKWSLKGLVCLGMFHLSCKRFHHLWTAHHLGWLRVSTEEHIFTTCAVVNICHVICICVIFVTCISM